MPLLERIQDSCGTSVCNTRFQPQDVLKMYSSGIEQNWRLNFEAGRYTLRGKTNGSWRTCAWLKHCNNMDSWENWGRMGGESEGVIAGIMGKRVDWRVKHQTIFTYWKKGCIWECSWLWIELKASYGVVPWLYQWRGHASAHCEVSRCRGPFDSEMSCWACLRWCGYIWGGAKGEYRRLSPTQKRGKDNFKASVYHCLSDGVILNRTSSKICTSSTTVFDGLPCCWHRASWSTKSTWLFEVRSYGVWQADQQLQDTPLCIWLWLQVHHGGMKWWAERSFTILHNIVVSYTEKSFWCWP